MNKIEEIIARFTMEDRVFLSTWNERTKEYTVSFEGEDLLQELETEVQKEREEAEEHEKETVEAICKHLGVEGLSIKRINGEIISIESQTKGGKE